MLPFEWSFPARRQSGFVAPIENRFAHCSEWARRSPGSNGNWIEIDWLSLRYFQMNSFLRFFAQAGGSSFAIFFYFIHLRRWHSDHNQYNLLLRQSTSICNSFLGENFIIAFFLLSLFPFGANSSHNHRCNCEKPLTEPNSFYKIFLRPLLRFPSFSFYFLFSLFFFKCF